MSGRIINRAGVEELVSKLEEFLTLFEQLPATDQHILEENVSNGTTGMIEHVKKNLYDALKFE